MFRCWRHIFFLTGLASVNLLAISDVGCATVPEPGNLRAAGKVDFPISCTPAVQSEFARGVALLHSFFYEEARRIFTSVAEQDPKCAMAQWAMGMTAGTDRERGFITALNVYYNTPDTSAADAVGQSCHGPVGPRDRVVAYEKAMRQLYDK